MAQMNSKFGTYYNPTFSEIWGSSEAFITDYNECEIPQTITESSATTLFWLLYARYGNNVIASTDRNRFKYAVFATVFQYGPTWEKRLSIQQELRDLTPKDLELGNTQINNHAYNPNTEPSTNELSYISDQHVTKAKRGKLEGYAMLSALLETDITGEFLNRFRPLFTAIASPQTTLLYDVSGVGASNANDEDNYLEV